MHTALPQTGAAAAALTPAALAGAQMRDEFPWLPDSLHETLEHVAAGKVVVPDLELDRQVHALCLLSMPYLRLSSIMFEHVGHVFVHRPACDVEPGTIESIVVKPLSDDENHDFASQFGPLLTEMGRLEGHDSMVNRRRVEPGVYTREEYAAMSRADSVTLN